MQNRWLILAVGIAASCSSPTPETTDVSAAEDTEPVETPVAPTPQILFGDLHVHSTFSLDAMVLNSPILDGRGFAGPEVRCDYARFCSQLDFWSINDHAEQLAPSLWPKTVAAVRTCDQLGGGDTDDPTMVSFLGWEWTQVGETPEDDWGHKNVVMRDLDKVPARPIAAGRTAGDLDPAILQQLPDLALAVDPDNNALYELMRDLVNEGTTAPICAKGVDPSELPLDCQEVANDPGELFDKLDQIGLPALVIPHGNTWGAHHPQLASWAAQLNRRHHRPDYQRVAEIASGHGSMETYRPWRAVEKLPDGSLRCPAPSEGFTPCCWRAGELTRERDPGCLDEPESEACEALVVAARQAHADAGLTGVNTVKGTVPADWQDCGQCTDCAQPAFNHRPAFSLQAGLAMSSFEEPEEPWRYRLGIIGSTDSHDAGPGAGFKEGREMSDVFGPGKPEFEGLVGFGAPFLFAEWERQQSYFYSGALVAVHALGRGRGAIWDSLQKRQVYATSGERIMLWFDLLGDEEHPMGSEVTLATAPTFRVKAVGSWKQADGCAQELKDRAPAGFVDEMCYGECYNPTDERYAIQKIEVVKITPQTSPDQPLEELIEDPYWTFDCPADPAGCTAEFTDDAYVKDGRPALYYARVLQEPIDQFNAGTEACPYGYNAGQSDCMAMDFERAWSSPIFVDPK